MGWPLRKLSDVVKVDGTMTKEYEKYADYPHIGIDSIEKNTGILSGYRTVQEDNVISPKYYFGPQHILYSKIRPALNKVALPDFEGLCSADCYPLLVTGMCDRKFLAHVMRSDYFLDYVLSYSGRSQMPKVNRKQLEGFSFPCPPIELQEKFTVLIDQSDKSKFTGFKSQFIEMFDKPEYGFKEIPIIDACSSKNDIKCGPFGTQLKQSEYTESGVAIWGIPQINSEFSIKPDAYVTAEKAIQLESYSLISGDIAMSRKGNVGQCAIYPEGFLPGIIASDVLRIRIDQTRLLPRFMQYQLHHSDQVRQQILKVSNGAVMAGINVTKLKAIKVFIPPMELQETFVELVKQSDKSK